MPALTVTRQIVLTVIRNTTGVDHGVIGSNRPIKVDGGDFVEIVMGLEARFDCTLDLLGAGDDLARAEWEIDVDDLAAKIQRIVGQD